MPPLDEAIRNLQMQREKHRQRIERIDAALQLLADDSDLEGLFAVELPKRIGIREAVLGILRDQEGTAMDVSSIFDLATDRGWRSTSDNPRNALASTLAKLATAGEIEKVGRGLYRSPDLAPAADTAASGALLTA